MSAVEPNDQRRESDQWAEAHAARAEANDLAAKAAEAAARASELEAKATAGDEGVSYEKTDPLAGTWEGAVSDGTAGNGGDGQTVYVDGEGGGTE